MTSKNDIPEEWRNAVYQAADDQRLLWRHWPEDACRTEAEPLYLMYDCASDDTHLMNPLGVMIIRLLQEAPADGAELLQRLAEKDVAEDEMPTEEELLAFLAELQWKGILNIVPPG